MNIIVILIWTKNQKNYPYNEYYCLQHQEFNDSNPSNL